MKYFILIIILALFIGCEPDPVIQDIESNSVITYYAYHSPNCLRLDSLTPYTIRYSDPQYGDTLQKTTFNGEWEHQMSFKGDEYRFEIYHYSYIDSGPFSAYPVPDSLYTFPDGCQGCIYFEVYVNGIRVLGGENHDHSLCESGCGEFYNPDGPNWNHRYRIGYAYDRSDPYNPEIYNVGDYYLEN